MAPLGLTPEGTARTYDRRAEHAPNNIEAVEVVCRGA